MERQDARSRRLRPTRSDRAGRSRPAARGPRSCSPLVSRLRRHTRCPVTGGHLEPLASNPHQRGKIQGGTHSRFSILWLK